MLGNTDHIMPGSAQLEYHDVRAKEVGEGVRVAVSFSRERERYEGRERKGREWGELDWRVRGERQPIRLGDDSPMVVFIASGGREVCGGGGGRGQTVWEAARTTSLHRRQGVVSDRDCRDEARGMKRGKEKGKRDGWWEGQSRKGGWKRSAEKEGGEDE